MSFTDQCSISKNHCPVSITSSCPEKELIILSWKFLHPAESLCSSFLLSYNKSLKKLLDYHNNSIYFAHESVVWAWLCEDSSSLLHLASPGCSKAGGWNHLNTYSFKCLGTDTGYWLGSQVQLLSEHLMPSCHMVTWLLHSMWLGSQGQVFRNRENHVSATSSFLTSPWKSHNLTSSHYILEKQEF